MRTADEKRASVLTEEVNALKEQLLKNGLYMSNADTFDTLDRIGEILYEKNELTGLDEDVYYFYRDDGESVYAVAGFVGDEAGVQDANGTKLKIGDTVRLSNGYERLILIGLPDKDSMAGAVKVKDYPELDIKDTFNAAFTVTLNSCLERYQDSLERKMEMSL